MSPPLLRHPLRSTFRLGIVHYACRILDWRCTTRLGSGFVVQVDAHALHSVKVSRVNLLMPITDHSECVRQAHPSSFFGDELLRALTEESFGIKAFSTIATTQLQATASVTLLEGQTIHIKLETRGYSVRLASLSAKIEGPYPLIRLNVLVMAVHYPAMKTRYLNLLMSFYGQPVPCMNRCATTPWSRS